MTTSELHGRRGRPRRGAAVAVVLAALLPLSACGSDEDVQAVAGDVVDGRPGSTTDGRVAEVVVPTGVLDVAVGAPVGDLDPDQTLDLIGQTAPADGAFVPIEWRFDEAPLEDLSRFLRPDGDLEVELLAGRGDDAAAYPLPAPTPSTGRGGGKDLVWVAVDGAPDDLRLRVTYDGVGQEVRASNGKISPGLAAGMYDLPRASRRTNDCDGDDWFPSDAAVTYECEVGAPVLLPYADGAWARRGTLWLVAAIRTGLSQYVVGRDGGARTAQYSVDKVVDGTTLDGERPEAVIEEARDAGYYSGALVFAVSGEVEPVLDVSQEFSLSVGKVDGLDAPSELQVTAEGSVTMAD